MPNTRDSETAGEAEPDASEVKESATISEALELIFARGTGAWVLRVCLSLSLSCCVQGLESNVTVYVASCFKSSFASDNGDVALLASANYAGQVLGSLLLCPLGDIYGRKVCLVWYNSLIAVCALLSAFAPSVNALILCRALVGFFQGPTILGLDYVMEVIPLARRGELTNYVCAVAWGFGTLLINVLAYLILPHWGWRPLLAITAIPFGLCVFSLSYLVESPRWLASQGRTEEAFQALEQIAKVNGTYMPCRNLIVTHLSSTPLNPRSHDREEELTVSSFFGKMAKEYKMLFSTERLVLLAFLTGQWFTGGWAYVSVVLYQGDILGGVKSKGQYQACSFDYSFNIIVSASEIFGGFLMMPFIDQPHLWYGGRRGTQIVSFSICGFAVVLAGYGVQPVTLYACIARALINGGTGVQNIQGPEALEVDVRATGSGYLNMVCLLGATFCSYWVYSPYSQDIVSLGIAFVIFLSGVFTCFVPETALTDLDTAEVYEYKEPSPRIPKLIKTDRVLPARPRHSPQLTAREA